MIRKFLPRSFAAALMVAVVLAFCSMRQNAGAQINVSVVSTQDVNSTQATGTSQILALDGKFNNCTFYGSSSTGSVSVTASGNTQNGQIGPTAPYITTSSITVNSTSIVGTVINMAQAPVGAFFTWSGNGGTFHGWMTCSGVIASTATAAISSLPPLTIASLPPVSNNCLTNCTPSPAATNATDLGINVHISGSTAAPLAVSTINPSLPAPQVTWPVTTPVPAITASPGLVPAMVRVGPSPGSQAGFTCGTATNCAAVDSNGHQPVNVCSSISATCAGLVATSNGTAMAGIVSTTKTKLSATVTTCTNLSSSASVAILGVLYPPGTAQTGTLTLYDESTNSCTAADAFYTSTTRASSTVAIDYLYVKVTTGITYEWTTNAEVGNVFLLTF